MADVNRGNRPLSPHLMIYRPQITSMLSILNRITGVGMALGAFMLVWWLLAAATDAAYFDFVNGLMTSWLGYLIWFGLTWALCYHMLNGLRHLWWDMGNGFDLQEVEFSGKLVVGASVVCTLLIWIIA